jgi:sortase (surface protein transpeptidase)
MTVSQTMETGAEEREPEQTAPSTQPAPSPAPVPPPPPAQAFTPNPVVRAVGLTLMFAALMFLGFFIYLYGLSGLTEQRSQDVLYKSFAGQLALATAPVGSTGEGAPVAIVAIPKLAISDLVVVEGTTSGDLMRGPGHVRSSVLPGQAGVSVIYGRVATFGAPFAHLMRLNRGDTVKVTTGQGVATYTVESFGTAASPAPDPTANRLVLETGDSAVFPRGAVMVTADLTSAPQPSPGGAPAITAQERYLAGDPSSLIPLALWSQALLLTMLAGTILAHRWSRWAAYLSVAPVALALLWSVYENLAILLPNLY